MMHINLETLRKNFIQMIKIGTLAIAGVLFLSSFSSHSFGRTEQILREKAITVKNRAIYLYFRRRFLGKMNIRKEWRNMKIGQEGSEVLYQGFFAGPWYLAIQLGFRT